MSDSLLTASSDLKERLSIAYITMIANAAGYNVQEEDGLDRDSIDLTIKGGGFLRPQIAIQAKATINLDSSQKLMPYNCSIKNYNDLRADTMIPRILVIMKLPRRESQWLYIGKNKSFIKNCLYWHSLKGSPEKKGQGSAVIKINRENKLDIQSLRFLMDKARKGTL